MNETFDVSDYAAGGKDKSSRYERRIAELQSSGFYTQSIESAVEGAISNIAQHQAKSFVIYGEPQSGKTEMMIALTARLLDEGKRLIVVLLNDSVQLLEQNLDRFLRSGLDPAPKKFSEILDPSIDVSHGTWVIFCKKNSADLQKLLSKIGNVEVGAVIDDEADYATPNSKINQNDKTRINELVERLLGSAGIYIGVTATPARLDLNNTFHNQNEYWVDFPPHPLYTGQQVFFPTTSKGFDREFGLELLPNQGDDPKYLRNALASFLVNVAYLNTQINKEPTNYCMLVHTSGKKADHSKDYQQIVDFLTVVKDSTHPKYESRLKELFDIASTRYPNLGKKLTLYVLEHIGQSDVVIMNSDTAGNAAQYRRATSPATLFTIAIGGNIVSRGVTFDNLLSMFFTRDVKHKIQQDTYIQRARMFGSRGTYLRHFELHIPVKLYLDWQKCFVFHQLALSFIRAGKGTPIWIEDTRIAAIASASIDRAAVALDSGEMSWDIFEFDSEIDSKIAELGEQPVALLDVIASIVGDNALPRHVLSFIDSFSFGNASIAVHKTSTVNYGDEQERREIRRRRGYMATHDLEKSRFPKAIHHLKVYKNDQGLARVFYKYTPEIGTVRFLRNMDSGSTP